MIQGLYYVRCDVCGTPAGAADDLTEDSRAARRFAEKLGWHIRRNPELPYEVQDRCPDHPFDGAQGGAS